MSKEYDEYLLEHRNNVEINARWIMDNLSDVLIASGVGDLDKVEKNLVMNIGFHDISKYSDEEYRAYDDYFYKKDRDDPAVKEAFDRAWLHHIHNNPHHWQHWVLVNDDPDDGTVALKMPIETVIEMISDWWSFSRKTGNLHEIFPWYESHKDRMILHDDTRTLVENILDAIHKNI